jgi:hypothetical protein
VLVAPYFGCLCVCVCVFVAVSSFVLDGKMVDFGDCSRTVLAFKPAVNDVDHALSSWKMEVPL